MALKNVQISGVLTKVAVFSPPFAHFLFQVEACFAFICALSSHHASHNLKYKPQVPV